jgi:hypothetical protein
MNTDSPNSFESVDAFRSSHQLALSADVAGQRFDRVAAACSGEAGRRPCSGGTRVEPRRRAGQTRGECRPSRRAGNGSDGTGSARARIGSGWCQGSRRVLRHRVDARRQGRSTHLTPRPRTSSGYYAVAERKRRTPASRNQQVMVGA